METMLRDVGAATICMVAELFWAGDPLSVAVAVNFAVPPTLGVPTIAPVAAESERPAGSCPEVIAHV